MARRAFTLAALLAHEVAADGIKHIGKHDKWQYETTTNCDAGKTQKCGPNEWHTVPSDEACAEHGTQSPIDASFATALISEQWTTSDLEFHYDNPDTCAFDVAFELNEHTTELAFLGAESGCNVPHVMWKGKKFDLKQFHYHSPSEHTIDRGHFPMEVHHVHQSPDDGQALVVAVMMGLGEPKSAADKRAVGLLDTVWNGIPRIPPGQNVSNYHERDEVAHDEVNPYTHFIPDVSNGFYNYLGSFTTPPCTAGTEWIIVADNVIVPEQYLYTYRAQINANPDNQLAPYAQITSIPEPVWHKKSGKFFWDTTEGSNNRPIQPLKGAHQPNRALWSIPQGESDSMIAASSSEDVRGVAGVCVALLAAWVYSQ